MAASGYTSGGGGLTAPRGKAYPSSRTCPRRKAIVSWDMLSG